MVQKSGDKTTWDGAKTLSTISTGDRWISWNQQLHPWKFHGGKPKNEGPKSFYSKGQTP